MLVTCVNRCMGGMMGRAADHSRGWVLQLICFGPDFGEGIVACGDWGGPCGRGGLGCS